MEKVLYIDDEANKGWGLVLKKIFNEQYEINDDDFFIIEDLDDAFAEIKKGQRFDLILLDLRFGETDHKKHTKIENYGGYRLLKEIRQIDSTNYSTPVIIFTASNKIWSIDKLQQAGADGYFIKEHPDFAHDTEFSRNNYKNFLSQVTMLAEKGSKRRNIWDRRREIIKLSGSNISKSNIKERIDEKLKMGYAIFNRKETSIEKEQLVFNKEILMFLVFWSILEEISHDFLIMDYSELPDYPKSAEIIVKGTGERYIEDLLHNDGSGYLSIYDVNKSNYSKKYKSKDLSNEEFRSKTLQINLSNEIASILHFKLKWDFESIKRDFLKPLNNYRNEIDFIHSSHSSIFNNKIKDNQNSEEAYNKSIEMLDFIICLLVH